MESVYHIVAIRVNETSWAHVWRLRSRYLRTGYDRIGIVNVKTETTLLGFSLSQPQLNGEVANVMSTSLSWIILNMVNSFLCSSTNYFKNRLLPNDLIIVRNHGDDEEDE
jgi:hypothetical protein